MAPALQEAQERLAALGPWFYEFDLGAYGRTVSSLPPDVLPIHHTRLQMVTQVVDGYFGSRLREIRCLDVGCHEGYYSVAMARKGMREVRGVDVRESSLAKAAFVRDALELGNLAFERQNCEELRGEDPSS
jgi:2-polyprenyl-3-methyl-5-hydroxy-6-metoxy-1,4-benzoquinol methylase